MADNVSQIGEAAKRFGRMKRTANLVRLSENSLVKTFIARKPSQNQHQGVRKLSFRQALVLSAVAGPQ